jgi:hypothetical protein
MKAVFIDDEPVAPIKAIAIHSHTLASTLQKHCAA